MEIHMSRRKNLPRKKCPVNEDILSGQTVPDISSTNCSERSLKCNVTTDGHLNQDADVKKKSMDVVSFTFTSPLSRSMPDISSTSPVAEKRGSSCFYTDTSGDNDMLFLKSSAFHSSGFNIIGWDAPSTILEKKLQELTCRIESSNCNIIIEGASASPTSSSQNSLPSSDMATTTSTAHHRRLQVDLDKDTSTFLHICNSCSEARMIWNHFIQSKETEEQNASTISTETGIEADNRHPGLLSTLEPVITSAGCSGSRNGFDRFWSEAAKDALHGGKKMQNRDWLAEEVNKEILGWKSMGDTMVDDLADKDMSMKHGRWLDFDMEALEEGVEIVKNILTCLVDELVSDFLL
ncbi:uncharacterized protein LOC120167319 [Hibiscus syriacus]|uniref:uncharacterized protein LOC120167319 n=1 Tax=Hibiscus syriacus TaxID=106335 RepID=UPI001924FE3F|nr:uncharacterized protein LOC120167319 [Hibiscus syriacus]